MPPLSLVWLGRYGADEAEVLSAADNGSLAVLLAITSGISLAISRSAVFLVIFLLLMLLVRMLCRRLVEQNLPPPSRKSRWRKLVSALLGALTGLVLVYTLSAAVGDVPALCSGRFPGFSPFVDGNRRICAVI